MSGALPETAKQAVEQLTGPRYAPGAYPLLQLAKDAVHGHQMIGEKVREHAERIAAEHDQLRAAAGAEKVAAAAGQPGAT